MVSNTQKSLTAVLAIALITTLPQLTNAATVGICYITDKQGNCKLCYRSQLDPKSPTGCSVQLPTTQPCLIGGGIVAGRQTCMICKQYYIEKEGACLKDPIPPKSCFWRRYGTTPATINQKLCILCDNGFYPDKNHAKCLYANIDDSPIEDCMLTGHDVTSTGQDIFTCFSCSTGYTFNQMTKTCEHVTDATEGCLAYHKDNTGKVVCSGGCDSFDRYSMLKDGTCRYIVR